jgi:hypothetical protein
MKLIKLLLFCCLFFSCGYLDDDGLLFQRKILGKFNVQQQKHTERPELCFSYSPENSMVIINDCKSIIYDTINKKIFIEKFINPYITGYSQITILDSNTVNGYDAYKEHTLTAKRFKYLTSKCNSCKTINIKP